MSSITGSIEIEVTKLMKVAELQDVIEERMGVEPDRQNLRVKNGHSLEDDQLVLGAAEVTRNTIVEMGIVEAEEGARRRAMRVQARLNAQKVRARPRCFAVSANQYRYNRTSSH